MIKKILTYSIIMVPLGIILAFLIESDANNLVIVTVFILSLIIVGIFMLDIGRLIGSDKVRKIYYICVCAFFVTIILFILATELFDDLNERGFLTMIFNNVLFSTFGLVVFFFARAQKKERKVVGYLLYALFVLIIIFVIINNILFIVGAPMA